MSFRIATRSLRPAFRQSTLQVQLRSMSSAKDEAVSLKDKAAEKVKQVAQKFKADGEVGHKFTSEGEVGKKFDQEVGGAFSKEMNSGAIGKQFEKDGAVGGTGQQAAEKTEQAAKEAKK